MKLFSGRQRDPSLGPYPLERVPRAPRSDTFGHQVRTQPLSFGDERHPDSILNAMDGFMLQMDRMRDGPVAPTHAAIPENPGERARHLKAAAYFLDASMVGICAIAPAARLPQPIRHPRLVPGEHGTATAGAARDPISMQLEASKHAADLSHDLPHGYACVCMLEFLREPTSDEPGGSWIAGTQAQRAALRANEIAVILAQYLRWLGYSARAHSATTANFDLDALAIASGLTTTGGSWSTPRNPFLAERFGLAAVTTDMQLATDGALDSALASSARGFRWWLGYGGTRPGYAGELFRNRPYHLGLYPMEKVKRAERTTTLIESERVPRVPKRHDMFNRAAAGDLGPKAQREMQGGRCVTKSPLANAVLPLMAAFVPLQNGERARAPAAGTADAAANTRAVKAALHYLGADIVGVSEAPAYAWYSHQLNGTPIAAEHKYAVSVLIDQGYNTFDGSSGDDWMNAAQSQRGYLRASLVCGIVAAHIRSLGYGARAHSNAFGDVLQIPLMLLAGLGELSRIGEVVLNPFLGPRFKSGVITTDLPLLPEQPIDFGLQDFCTKCSKCARECPCSAIPFGPKIMFNGYEMWKPDVEKCARYRITNSAGAMCGRCLKTCPYNLEGVLSERPFQWAAMHLPFARKWVANLDDKVGNGAINARQKWWWDLDTAADGRIVAAARTNARPLNFRPPLAHDQQKLAAFPFGAAPPPVTDGPVVPDRKEGVDFYRAAEIPVRRR